jgi:uncharacterized membrane protein HdeD (DUF308 family)
LWLGLTLAVLVLFDGILLIAGAVAGWHEIENYWLMLLEGIVGVVVDI